MLAIALVCAVFIVVALIGNTGHDARAAKAYRADPAAWTAEAYRADPAAWTAAAAAVREALWVQTLYDKQRWGREVAGVSVDEVGLDENGGVWLRTGKEPDFIDMNSYGLYHQPPGGSLMVGRMGATTYPTSPFGGKDVRIKPLGEGWHTFRANDDFY